MLVLNRSLLVVKPKQPFVDWLRTLPDPDTKTTVDDLAVESGSYLLPQYDYDEERDQILKAVWEEIFAEQLAGWWTDETDWPKNRILGMFKDWFTVEFHSMLVDLADEPLEHEEF